MKGRNHDNPAARICYGSDRDLVESLLAANTRNRTPKQSSILVYADEMQNGNWRLTNQGIGLSKTGVLLDGQNRLLAMRMAGYPHVPFLLVTGLDEDSANYIDIGSKRSTADLLKLVFNVTLAGRLAAAISCCLKVRKGSWAQKFTPSELIQGYHDFGKEIYEICHVEGAQKLPAPVISALAEVVRQHGAVAKVSKFTEQILKGELLQAGDPALTLRNWLAAQAKTGGVGGSGPGQRERYWKTLRAAEAFVKGEKLHKLYYVEGDLK
jgi:hypothetical protein